MDGMSKLENFLLMGGLGYLIFFIVLPIGFFYVLGKTRQVLIDYTVAEKKYNKQKNKNNFSQEYTQVKQLFTALMKNGDIKRNDILQFKNLLNKLLETNIYHYDKFYFKNDCHEIYIKLKNSNLTKVDYLQLQDYLKNFIKKKKNS